MPRPFPLRQLLDRALIAPLVLTIALGVAGCSVGVDVHRADAPTATSVSQPGGTAVGGGGALPSATVAVGAPTATSGAAPASTVPASAAPTSTIVAPSSVPTVASGASTAPTQAPTVAPTIAPTSQPAPTATTAPAAPPSVAPTSAPSASVAPTAAAEAAVCRGADLQAEVAWDAGAGGRNGTVTLTNGGAACTIPGMPTVQVINGQRQVLPVTQRNDAADAELTSASVTVQQGQVATLLLRWSNYCGVAPDKAASLLVTLPGTAGAVQPTGGLSVPPCLGEGQPSNLGVQPLQLNVPAATVVANFYDAINSRDYRRAYALRAPDYQAQQAYDDFAAGYAGTQSVTVFVTSVTPTGDGRFTVGVRLAARQTGGPVQRFTGTYTLVGTGDTVQIAAANIVAQ